MLYATDANGCADTLTVTVNCNFGKVPQLVTPNGDGHNDVWNIPGIDKFPEATVELYNRWGTLIFKASPYLNNWEGYSAAIATVGNGRLPSGTYFYVIQLTKDSKAITGYIELQY
jgi:gliding motility-associated-like protein